MLRPEIISAVIIFLNLLKFSFGDATLDFIEKTAQNGYTSEEHTVTTQDGYILTIFRMYPSNKTTATGTPVLLLHGFFQDSNCWIDSGVDAGLAYNLSDAGYDTWVGNLRGNSLAMKHECLDADVDADYWKYSIDEIGRYDIPAIIDYILSSTGAQKLNSVAFSISGTGGLVTFSERPEYCEKVGVFIALAPTSRLNYTVAYLKNIVEDIADTEEDINQLGIYTIFKNATSNQQTYTGVNFYLAGNATCRNLISNVDNPHPGSITNSTYENLCTSFPAPTALRVLAAFGQISKSGKFQKYDYGETENEEIYGCAVPPEYNVTSVSVPVVILQGLNDPDVNVTDVKWLSSQLPNLLELCIIDDPEWTHVDMIYSQYSTDRLYPKIHEYLGKYSDCS